MKRLTGVFLLLALLLNLCVGVFAEEAAVTAQVQFRMLPVQAQITVSSGIGYTYTQNCFDAEPESSPAENTDQYRETSFVLETGTYTATITAEGYYAATLSFEVTQKGELKALANGNVQHYMDDAAIAVELTPFTAATAAQAWDGVTLDVSWYAEEQTVFYLSEPAQLAGLAAIVNGIYNAEITTILDDSDDDGTPEQYTPTEYAVLESRKIRPVASSGDVAGPNGNNMVTTDTYWYGVKSDGVTPADFNGKTVCLTTDLDMGGYRTEDGEWTGARYMPVGGQYLMHYINYGVWESDGYSHLSASFNGTLDGQGHTVNNLYCDRYAAGSNFGDSSTIGLIGRLGNHDNDPASLAAVDPTVRNVAVDGYVYGRRSVGGIVGKIGQTSATRILGDLSTGGIIESCVNYATVHNTDAKGCGGIVGAGWNDGVVRNCANFGTVYTSYRCPTGGISGSNEVTLLRCYNVGSIYAATSGYESYAMAIGTNNGGASTVTSCFWLTGSATGGYYSGRGDVEITDNYNGSGLSAADYMKSEQFLSLLCGETRDWVLPEDGYPLPRSFTHSTATVVRIEKTADPTKLSYIEGQEFDPEGLKIIATYSDGTQETLNDYSVSPDKLQLGDTQVTVSGVRGGIRYSYVFPITVMSDMLLSVKITVPPVNTLYASNEAVSPEGMTVCAYFASAPDKAVVLAQTDYTWTCTGNVLEVRYTLGTQSAADSLLLTILNAPTPKKDAEGYYLIGSQEELLWFANQVNALSMVGMNGRLTADLLLNETYPGIGTAKNLYEGTFDGQGFSICLDINATGAAGLLAYAGGACVRNLTLTGSVQTTAAGAGAGAFAGYVGKGRLNIENCESSAVISSPGYAGGFVGKVMSGSVQLTHCRNSGAVTASGSYAGGMVGYCAGSLQLSFCENNAAVSSEDNSGGIAGCIDATNAAEKTILSDCRNTGRILADGAAAGGIAGYTTSSSDAIGVVIVRCSNEGAIESSSNAGGLTGCMYGAYDRISDSFNLGEVFTRDANAGSGTGGIAGVCKGTLSGVYNLGGVCSAETTATAAFGIGGIAGLCSQNGQSIDNAYAAGTVTAPQGAACGGLIGRVAATLCVSNSYFVSDANNLTGIGYVLPGKTADGEILGVESSALKALSIPLEGFAVNTHNEYHSGYPVLLTELSGEAYTVCWIVDGSTMQQPYPAGATPEYYGKTEKADDQLYAYTFTGWTPAVTAVTEDAVYTACYTRQLRQITPDGRFSDVRQGSWYYADVYTAAGLGLVNGIGNGLFSPETSLTRAMIVQILYNAEGQPEMTAETPFTDVKAGSWYEAAVLWASANGIVTGVGNGKFDPNGKATREQLATILYRYAKSRGCAVDDAANLTGFADFKNVSSWAETQMRWAVAKGMINGMRENGVDLIAPRATATRSQVAAILIRFLRAYV